MASCHQCGASHIDALERRGGLCATCYAAKQKGSPLPAPKVSCAPTDNPKGMPILRGIAMAAFCLAGLGVLTGFTQENLSVVFLSVTVGISGVLFLALDRIVIALEAIREAITERPTAPVERQESRGNLHS